MGPSALGELRARSFSREQAWSDRVGLASRFRQPELEWAIDWLWQLAVLV